MEFTPDVIISLVHQLESVRSITIHMSVTIRNTTAAEQEHHLVSSLWTQTDEIPEHVRVLEKRKFFTD